MGAAMGGAGRDKPADDSPCIVLSPHVLPSLYQQRVTQLIRETADLPPEESLETTLRRCIAFCYNVTPEWAPHVRVTVYADNVSEHQLNVPVLSTLLCCMGERGFEAEAVPCKPIPGTDVQGGVIRPSVFWTRLVSSEGLHFRSLAHSYLKWFVDLEDTDSRKQLLVNILLQMHEACYNCVGRHKEVFEFCIYDLMTAEQMQKPAAQPSNACHTVIFQHAARFLDRHKRNALHAAYLSPLKYMFQHIYEVYENLDSHGSSFWVAVLSIFFPDLDMPFERIEQLDTGWGWAAVDFLPSMSSKPSSIALDRFSNPENLGRDWRSLTRDLPAPSALPRRFRYLPLTPGPNGFEEALRRIHSRQSVRQQFARYVERFTSFMQEDSPGVVWRSYGRLGRRACIFLFSLAGFPCVTCFTMRSQDLLLRCWATSAVTSERWDAELGPALSTLSEDTVGQFLTPFEVRDALCSLSETSDINVNTAVASSFLAAAGITWA